MSKKANKSQSQNKAEEIVDQEVDPMLRTLQKKVRNMNKKLNQISQLEAKKDLKPQQQQKISKKAQIIQQKQKYVQMIQVYRQIASQNQKNFRKSQLLQLQDLALVIALKQYSVDVGFLYNQNIDNLVRVMTTPTSSEITLGQRVKQLSNALHDAANNSKLKKTIKQFYKTNPDYRKAKTNEAVSNQPEPLSPQSEEERQAQLKQLQEQQKINPPRSNNIQPLTPTVTLEQAATPAIQVVQEQSKQNKNKDQTDKHKSEQPLSKPKENVENPQQNAKVQNQQVVSENKVENQNKQKNQEKVNNGDSPGGRGYNKQRGGRGRHRNKPRQNQGERNYNQKPYKKPSFKPKYEQQPKHSDDSSSVEQEPQARQFKRQQVKQLIQDGFIVVGKPKVKARDQKEYHERQHGRKYHQPHTKKNY